MTDPRPAGSGQALFTQFGTDRAMRLAGSVSMEGEFVVRRTHDGAYCPMAHIILRDLWSQHHSYRFHFTEEFFGGQLELKTRPHRKHEDAVVEYQELLAIAQSASHRRGYELVAEEYVPDEVKFPDHWVSPLSERYRAYATEHPYKVDSMFRVAAWQVRFGCGTLEQAIAVHNVFAQNLRTLVSEGWADPRRIHRFGETIFPVSDKPLWPPKVADIHELIALHAYAGTLDCPKQYYAFVRIDAQDKEGVELRVGGATGDPAVMTARIARAWGMISHLF